MYDPNSQKNSWPKQEHRLEFIKYYLLERIRISKINNINNSILDLCDKVSNDINKFNTICIGIDVIYFFIIFFLLLIIIIFYLILKF